MNKLVLAIMVLLSIPALIKAQIDTNTVVYSWKLDESFSNHIRIPIDTLARQYSKSKSNLSGLYFCNYPGKLFPACRKQCFYRT